MKDIKKYYQKRACDDLIKHYLQIFKAVLIEGPKWCGKSWTGYYHSNSQMYLGDPSNNFHNRKLVELDINYALNGEFPRLIDEWQEIPYLFDGVRHRVDQLVENGCYLLTGSSTPTLKGIRHSGVGRIARFKMYPMSSYESGDSTGKVSLKELFTNKMEIVENEAITIENLAKLIIRGGFPTLIHNSSSDATLIIEKYLEALISDDLYRLDHKAKDQNKIKRLLLSLARNEATLISNNKIIVDIKENDEVSVDIKTINGYLDDLKRLFIIDDIQPFNLAARSKIKLRQNKKRHLVDPSIVSSILKLSSDKLLADLHTFGLLFESLVLRDLRVYSQANRGNLYHYHDYDDDEADAVVELADGSFILVEIKLGLNQVEQAASKLLKIQNKLKQRKAAALVIICGLSPNAYQREDGVIVVPFNALKF